MRKMAESARVDSRRNDPDVGGSPMPAGFSQRRRRSSRVEKRRRQFWWPAVRVGGVLLIAAAFAAGYLWRSGEESRRAREAPGAPTDKAARLEARLLLDEAVRARYEERWQGAMNALAEARRTDPATGGLDLLFGEIAWEQREADSIRRAARESLRRGHNESGSKLLLALEKWMSRTPQETVTVGAAVRELLAEAGEASPSNAGAPFFHGELSRLLGDGATAHRSLVGALHRQTPWSSSALLSTKLQLAAAEASQLGRPVFALAPDAPAQAALELRHVVLAGLDVRPAFGEFLLVTPALQAVFLLQDKAFNTGAGGSLLRVLREQADRSLPQGKSEL